LTKEASEERENNEGVKSMEFILDKFNHERARTLLKTQKEESFK